MLFYSGATTPPNSYNSSPPHNIHRQTECFAGLFKKDCFRALSTLLRTINDNDRGGKKNDGRRDPRDPRFNEHDCLFVVSRCSSELYAYFFVASGKCRQARETLPSFYAWFNYLQSSFLRGLKKRRRGEEFMERNFGEQIMPELSATFGERIARFFFFLFLFFFQR